MAKSRGLDLKTMLYSVSALGLAAIAFATCYRVAHAPTPTSVQADKHAYWIDFKGPEGWDSKKSANHAFYFTDAKTGATMDVFLTHGLPGVDEETRGEPQMAAQYLVDGIKDANSAKVAERQGDLKEGDVHFALMRRSN